MIILKIAFKLILFLAGIIVFVYIPKLVFTLADQELDIHDRIRLVERCVNAARTQRELILPVAYINRIEVGRVLKKVTVNTNFSVKDKRLNAQCVFYDDRTEEEIDKEVQESVESFKSEPYLRHVPAWIWSLVLRGSFPVTKARLGSAFTLTDYGLDYREEVVKKKETRPQSGK